MSISGKESVFLFEIPKTGEITKHSPVLTEKNNYIAYAVSPSMLIGYGAAEINFNSCLAANKYLAFEKPGLADVFI